METWSNLLFYSAFLAQIFLISFYFPRQISARMKYVLDNYPPERYPKLYPKPLEYYSIGQWKFKTACRVVFVLGFVMLAAAVTVDGGTFADDGYISEIWPMVYGMIQFIPLMFLEFSEFSQFKLMRQMNSVSSRKAELRRRRLFDFVSPWLLGLALFLLLATLVLDYYANGYVFAWDQSLVIVGTNLLLAALGAWHLYGRKLNPHQSHTDRGRQISAALKSFLYVSMAMSVFIMLQSADDIFSLDFLDAFLMSLYFQAIAWLSIGHMLRTIRPEDVDFSVYKDEALA